MKIFTTGQILKLINVSPAQFDRWCAEQLVIPIAGGGGTGNHRMWSFPQAVGFTVANEIRNSERGCVPTFIGSVVEAFGAVTEDWLQSEFKEGRIYLVTLHQGRPLLSAEGKAFGWPNVQSVLNLTRKFAAKGGK